MWGRVCCSGVGVCLGCGWVSEFWTSGMSTVCFNSIWPKSGLNEFWKNTLQLH